MYTPVWRETLQNIFFFLGDQGMGLWGGGVGVREVEEVFKDNHYSGHAELVS